MVFPPLVKSPVRFNSCTKINMAASSPASAAESEQINTVDDPPEEEMDTTDTDTSIMNTSGEHYQNNKEEAPPNNNNNSSSSEDSGGKEDPFSFKKPLALFAAPSLAVSRQRGGGGPSKNKKTPVPPPPVTTTPTGSAAAAAEPPSRAATAEPPPPPQRHAPQEEASSSEEPAAAATSDQKVTSSEEEAKDGEKRHDKAVDGAVKKTQQQAKPRVPLPARGPPGAAPGFKAHPPVPYAEPPWGGVAAEIPYALEILKDGTIVDTVPLSQKSYFVVGRLPVCDVALEHPSISRYHAVIQYRGQSGEEECVGEERGFYLHDLGSTHGTVVNKNKIPPKTYIRLRVGHVVKFGGSTRLFILQGPEFDEEEESELTVTQLRERAQAQRAELEKRMMGEEEGSDGDDDDTAEGEGSGDKKSKTASADSGCSWGMGEESVPEEDENEENPFATEFREDQEAAYLKDPKKALQGFYDREGEELEFEYEDQNHGTWLCRIKLPVDDALGRQLVAEVTHTGKKKDAAVQCCLEACRILEARGLLRQEAVSRKRKKKNWEDEDYYDSDDDTFLDRTGVVEKKRQERMKKAGKIEERPETYDSLVAKLAGVEKELAETQTKLNAGGRGSSSSSTEDSLDAFMSAVRSEAAMDAVERRKLHVHVADLRKEAQRLRKLVELTRPAQMPSLQPSCSGTANEQKPKKSLPLFGAMKGGSKFKLKTGTIGKLPPKRPNLPAELFNMKGEEEEEEDDDEEEEAEEKEEEEERTAAEDDDSRNGEGADADLDGERPDPSTSPESAPLGKLRDQQTRRTPKAQSVKPTRDEVPTEAMQAPEHSIQKTTPASSALGDPTAGGEDTEPQTKPSVWKKSVKKKAMGPAARPLSDQYPEDDPDYCVWVPPSGQSGDGRTHLNDKFGY